MTTVHQAIGSVISELEGIGKNQRNKEQGYQFRGVDDVLKAVHPLLGKHGVFFCPDILEREYEERISAKGTVGHCAHLHVRYTVYGPDGDSVQLSTWGEGLDYGDKATNKAMTAAFKYALFELFAVADPTEDGDSETPPESRTTKTNRRAQGTVRRAPQQDHPPEPPSEGTPSNEVPLGLDAMTLRELTEACHAANLPTNGGAPAMRKRLSGAGADEPAHACATCGRVDELQLHSDGRWYCPDDLPF